MGALDTTFNSSGRVIFNIPWSSLEAIEDLAFQSDGRIVVAGWGTVNDQPVMALARFNANGSLDTTFNVGGSSGSSAGALKVDFPSFTAEQAFGVAVDSSGRAVVAGNALQNGATRFALARSTTSGTLDTSFGNNGEVTTDMGSGGLASASDLVFDAAGRIVVSGTSLTQGGPAATVARYSGANGSLDQSFGSGGSTNISIATADCVLMQGSQILIGGSIFPPSSNGNPAIFRLNDSGLRDQSFVTGRIVGVPGRVIGMSLAADGRIRLGLDDEAVDIGTGRRIRLPAYAVLAPDGTPLVLDRVHNSDTAIPLPVSYDLTLFDFLFDCDGVRCLGSGSTLPRPTSLEARACRC